MVSTEGRVSIATVQNVRGLLSLILVAGAGAILVACQGAEPIPANLKQVVQAIAETSPPPGWEARVYPTNNSLVEEVNTIPVDYTGSLTRRTTATIVYVSGAAPQDKLEQYCQEAVEYLQGTEAAIGITWRDSPLTAEACLEGLLAAQGSVTWTAESDGIEYIARVDSAVDQEQTAVALSLKAHVLSGT